MILKGLRSLTLRVRSLAETLRFYEETLGLLPADSYIHEVRLTTGDGAFHLTLEEDPDAPLRPNPSVGLYHFALLLPDRSSLGAILRRIVEQDYPLEGVADHGVSEALYLRDPEGNGLELYRDRPREEWPMSGERVAMYSAPLDLADLSGGVSASPLAPATRFGHIHLHCGDLEASSAFYEEQLGLDVTQRDFPGARFLAYGGYHHHVGLNLWARGRRAPEGATGLVSYAWTTEAPHEALVDPDGNEVTFHPA